MADPAGITVGGTTGIIGLLTGAISALWAWHMRTVNQKDKVIEEVRQEQLEVNKKLINVIESNTKAQTKQTSALKTYIKSNTELNRTVTQYVIEAAGKRE